MNCEGVYLISSRANKAKEGYTGHLNPPPRNHPCAINARTLERKVSETVKSASAWRATEKKGQIVVWESSHAFPPSPGANGRSARGAGTHGDEERGLEGTRRARV